MSKEQAHIAMAKKILGELKDAAKLGMQEMIHGDGSMVKALVGTVHGQDDVTFVSPYGQVNTGQAGLMLHEGGHYAVLDADNSNAVLGKFVAGAPANTGDACRITWTTGNIAGMAAGDKVVPCTDNDTAFDSGVQGAMKLLNWGGNYAALDGITHSRHDPRRLTAANHSYNGSTPVDMDLWRLFTAVGTFSGVHPQEKPNEFLAITTHGMLEHLANSFYGGRQWTMSEQVELKGGFKGVRVCGVVVTPDSYTPAGAIELFHTPSLAYVDAKDWGAVEYQNSGTWNQIPNRDAYETSIGTYVNISAPRRNTHGLFTGFTDTLRYTHVA
ncbi:MAG TPA: hypothetical protein PKC18_11385 [Lacipirellulaceae bacterium]|nr:hypothetical protein [Lacipirellulaceae bacterium]